MELEKVTAKIRPRRGWEAIDLGVTLVQNHAKVLYKIWFLTSLPVFLLISIVLYSSPLWATFCLWWLKPILERPILHFLSRELFGESLTVKQCAKDFYSVAKIQWFASLTWRRLSFTRSLDLPLIQLEGLKSLKRASRLKTLHSGDSGSAVWLTVVFFIIELTLYFSFIMLIFLLVPDVYLDELELLSWFAWESDSYMINFFSNCLIYLVMSFVAPFFVACGFSLYLNQRTHLEAWDIELSFKRLASRLAEKSENFTVRLASILLASCLIFSSTLINPKVLQAEEVENTPNQSEQQVVALDHDSAKNLIKEIKEGEDFHQMELRESNRFNGDFDFDWSEGESSSSSSSSGWLIFAQFLAMLVEFALWIFIAVLVIFLVLKYKHLMGFSIANKKIKHKRPKKIFGLDLEHESLPDKPWLVAKQLVEDEQYREAVSLLYRASLIRYIDQNNVLIKEGFTELECLAQIVQQVSLASQGYIKKLTNTWRGLAYAHEVPSKSVLVDLCDSWPVVMKLDSQKKSSSGIAIQKKTIDSGEAKDES